MQEQMTLSLAPQDSEMPQGLLVLGDAAGVLESLGPQLKGRVRCCYMDPPYCNGERYSHYDDTMGHDRWMQMMAGVLGRVWPLVAENGSVWISIDDGEMAYLKVLCDLHFGRGSYVATIAWEHRTTRENRAAFSHNHEYILVYAKDPLEFRRTRGKIPAPELADRYKNPDGDPRGPWQSVTATAQAGHAVPSQFYGIVSPGTGHVSYPPAGRCWVYNEERMAEEIAAGNVWFGADGNGAPRLKKFLGKDVPSVVPGTLWPAAEVGTATEAKKQLLKMFPGEGGAVFDTPKPEALLARILSIATSDGDLVLDPFLGSGTSAAVAQKMGRSYIGVDDSAASLSFAARRLDKVVAGEQSGISRREHWHGGGGYNRLELQKC